MLHASRRLVSTKVAAFVDYMCIVFPHCTLVEAPLTVPKGHPLAEKQDIGPVDLLRQRWIGVRHKESALRHDTADFQLKPVAGPDRTSVLG